MAAVAVSRLRWFDPFKILGLTPKAICCRRFATMKTRNFKTHTSGQSYRFVSSRRAAIGQIASTFSPRMA